MLYLVHQYFIKLAALWLASCSNQNYNYCSIICT